MKKFNVLFLFFILTGCTAHQDLVEGKGVTLTQAMKDTVDALAEAKEEGAVRKTNFGLYACTVTAEYKVAAIRTSDNKIALGVTGGPPAAIAPVSLSLTGSQETTDQGSRGSTVTLVLATPWCFPGNAAKAAEPGKAKDDKDSRKSKSTSSNDLLHGLGPSNFDRVMQEKMGGFPLPSQQLFSTKPHISE